MRKICVYFYVNTYVPKDIGKQYFQKDTGKQYIKEVTVNTF